MTKKNLFTLLAGFVLCGLTAISMASCSVDDSPAPTDNEIDYDITGKWVANLGSTMISSSEFIWNVLVSFDDDGVVRSKTYGGFAKEGIEQAFRTSNHNVYIMNKATHKMVVVASGTLGLPEKATYSIEGDQLILRNEANGLEYTFHRPTYEEIEEFNKYEEQVYASDFAGIWVRTYEENGQKNYVVADFAPETQIIRYTVTADGKVYVTDEMRYMDNAKDTKADPKIYIYEPGSVEDYKEYWWKTEGKNLHIGYYGSNETLYTYHQMTKEEYKLFSEYGQTAIISNLKEQLVGSWMVSSIIDRTTTTDETYACTYDADGTVHVTPSIEVLKKHGIWGHDYKGTYTINGNIVEQQVAVDDKNILFTQKMDVVWATSNALSSLSDVETFVDGKSVYVDKGLKENKARPSGADYSQTILGGWEASIKIGEDEAMEEGKNYSMHFYNDGTFKFHTITDEGEHIEVERTTSEYFIVNDLLYMRWQDKGSDEMKYQAWNIHAFVNNNNTGIRLTAVRLNAEGKLILAQVILNEILT